MNLKFCTHIHTHKWWSRAKFYRKIPTCRNCVAILNFDDIIKRNAKMAISFEPFISKPWFLYGKCLVFCSLSNEPSFKMIQQIWFWHIFREIVTWPTPVNFRISKVTLKHAPLDFIHTCESWSSYLKPFLSSRIFSTVPADR